MNITKSSKQSLFTKSALAIAIATATLALSSVATTQTVYAKSIANNPTLETPTIDTVKQIANEHPKIEVVFVLDTTGSMSGLIQAAKEKIWSIASTMASAENAPDIKMGLVAYRDRGDAYVTKTTPLSSDLDSMYSKLMDYKARGGGDGPESVNKALYDATHKMLWSQDDSTYKVIFLIGDAPAHMDYQDDVKYPTTIAKALKKGIVINAIQSGKNRRTTTNWQQIATLGQGDYFQVEDDGNAVAIATPFDQELAKLSSDLDNTRVYYGNKETKARQRSKMVATSKLQKESSIKSQARRASYNSSASGKSNFLGEGELVDEIISGIVDLASIAKSELPTVMQTMAPAAQEEYVQTKAKERKELSKSIRELAEKRDAYLKKEVAKVGANKDSFDAKVFGAIRKQAAEKGLMYEADSAKY